MTFASPWLFGLAVTFLSFGAVGILRSVLYDIKYDAERATSNQRNAAFACVMLGIGIALFLTAERL